MSEKSTPNLEGLLDEGPYESSLRSAAKAARETTASDRSGSQAAQLAVRHLVETNALDAEARNARAHLPRQVELEERHVRGRPVRPGDLDERVRKESEKLERQLERSRVGMQARHRREMDVARVQDRKQQ